MNENNSSNIIDVLEGILSPAVDLIVSDGEITKDEFNMIINLLSNMGVDVSGDMRAMVQKFLYEELQQYNLEQQQKESEQKDLQEEIDEQELSKLNEDKIESHDKEVSKIISGIVSIVGIGNISIGNNISPSSGISTKENDRSQER